MEEIVVSIIMPMHNSSMYVGEAIESVIAQSFKEWELIIVDDMSTDISVDIAKTYENNDKRIHVLRNNRHTSMPSAPRNFGIQHAKGQYIAFLDSDDRWLPHKLEVQLSCFNDEKVAIVFSNYEKINEKGRRAKRIVKAPSYVQYKNLLYSNYIGNLTGIYDRKKVGTILLPEVHHEDYALWLNILRKGFIAKNTETVEALYRVRENSVSSSKLHILAWQWNIYRKQEHLSILKSTYYYIHYAINGWLKSKI